MKIIFSFFFSLTLCLQAQAYEWGKVQVFKCTDEAQNVLIFKWVMDESAERPKAVILNNVEQPLATQAYRNGVDTMVIVGPNFSFYFSGNDLENLEATVDQQKFIMLCARDYNATFDEDSESSSTPVDTTNVKPL